MVVLPDMDSPIIITPCLVYLVSYNCNIFLEKYYVLSKLFISITSSKFI